MTNVEVIPPTTGESGAEYGNQTVPDANFGETQALEPGEPVAGMQGE